MTFLRNRLGKRGYTLVLAVLFLGALLYQKETGRLPIWTPPMIEPGDETGDTSSIDVRVLRVIDGDTFEIEGGERVRLIGVDAPETVKPNTPVECYGKNASAFLKNLIEGKVVRMERDRTNRDRYARLLRYVYLDGVFVNETLVREGYAESNAYRPDTREQATLDEAEHQARSMGRGQWADGICPVSLKRQ